MAGMDFKPFHGLKPMNDTSSRGAHHGTIYGKPTPISSGDISASSDDLTRAEPYRRD